MDNIPKAFFWAILMMSSGLTSAWAQSATPTATAGNVLMQSSEYRFQLDLHVNDAVLAKMLPAGWEPSVAAQGPAKDANLRLILVDCVDIVGPDNKVLGGGTNRLAMLAAPVKKSGGTDVGQMILGGISESTDVPDAYGVYLKASSSKMARSASAANGTVTETDDWEFAAPGGEHISLHVKFIHKPANRGGGETKFYNPADPSQYQNARTDQLTDIARNVTTNPPDRVLEFSYEAGGGKFSALLDGNRPLSWDSQPVYNRIISAN
jgi:hypothetical protein